MILSHFLAKEGMRSTEGRVFDITLTLSSAPLNSPCFINDVTSLDSEVIKSKERRVKKKYKANG